MHQRGQADPQRKSKSHSPQTRPTCAAMICGTGGPPVNFSRRAGGVSQTWKMKNISSSSLNLNDLCANIRKMKRKTRAGRPSHSDPQFDPAPSPIMMGASEVTVRGASHLMQAGATPSNSAGVSGTGQTRQTGQREAFSSEELAIVLSHFDIGILDSIIDYPRG